jgi:hypothetical protein
LEMFSGGQHGHAAFPRTCQLLKHMVLRLMKIMPTSYGAVRGPSMQLSHSCTYRSCVNAWHMPHKGLGTQSSVRSTVTIRLLHFSGLSQGSGVTCVDADEDLHK